MTARVVDLVPLIVTARASMESEMGSCLQVSSLLIASRMPPPLLSLSFLNKV